MDFFLGLLKLLFGKREPWTPLFMLSDCEDVEGPQLRFDCEGDYTGECCEILDRLCAGRFATIWMEDLFWMEQRQEKTSYTLTTTASLRTSIGDLACPEGERYLQTSLSEKDGNTLGFYLFPVTLYDSDGFLYAGELEKEEDRVTVTVIGLTRLTTWRQGTRYR